MQDVNSFPGDRDRLPPPPPTGFPTAAPLPPTLDRTWLRELAARQRWAIVGGIANGVGGSSSGPARCRPVSERCWAWPLGSS